MFAELYFEGYKRDKRGNDLSVFVNRKDLGGSSGGPILVGNQVVGIVKSGYHNMLLATPSETLISLLESPQEKNRSFRFFKEFLILRGRALKGDEEALKSLFSKGSSLFSNTIAPIVDKVIRSYYIQADDLSLSEINAMLSSEFSNNAINVKLEIADRFYRNNEKRKAFEIYTNLAKNGWLPAIVDLAIIAGKEGQREAMIKLFEQAGLYGDGHASYIMGTYKNLIDSSKDDLTHSVPAEEWFKLSAQQNYLPALLRLFDLYKKNTKNERDLMRGLNKVLLIYQKQRLFSDSVLKEWAKSYLKMNREATGLITSAFPDKILSSKKNPCLETFGR